MNNTIKRRIRANKIGRNDPCPCGSGKKYKKCCNNRIKPVERWDKIKNKNRKEWSSGEISHSELIDIAKKYGCNCHDQTIMVGWLDCMDCKKPCAGITDFIGKDDVVCPICGSNDVQVRMSALCTVPIGFKPNCLYACSKCGNIELYIGGGDPHCGICEHSFAEADKIQLMMQDDPISEIEHESCECHNPKAAWRSGDKLIPMDVEDAKECEEYFKHNPDAPPEDAERWRMKTDQTKIERCKKICEKFDSCDLVQIGQPNDPPKCTEFYNEDMFRQFYDSKDEILEHIKSFGYIPNIINDDNDDLDIGINILDHDGKLFPLFERHYIKDVDKKWKFESQDFYEFGKRVTAFGGSRELIKSVMKSKDDDYILDDIA